MESPIRRIIPNVLDSLIRIAPEREAETRALLEGVRFELTDEPDFDFHARKDGVISIPERGVELLWVVSYVFWQRYTAYKNAVAAIAAGSVPPDAQLQPSLDLIDWALANQDIEHPGLPWPPALPEPTGFEASVGEPRPERVADELAMCALGWLLHHELAHITNDDFRKVPPEQSRAREREADAAATRWLLDRAPQGMPTDKRALGIAVATVTLAALEIEGPPKRPELRTHPPAAERIDESLTHPALGDDNTIFVVAAIGLRLFMDRAEIPHYETPRECLAAYCLAVHRYLSRRAAAA